MTLRPLLIRLGPWLGQRTLWLAALGLAAGVGMLLAVGTWVERRELALKTEALRHAVEVHALGLRSSASKFAELPLACARHPALQALLARPQQPGLRQQVNQYLAELSGQVNAAALYLLDAQGLTLAASNWAQAGSFVGQNYRSRPYFEQALHGQRSWFYGVGLTTGVPGLFIAEPVRSAQGEQVNGVVVVKVGLEAVARAWQGSPTPVVLADAQGIVFMSSEPDWLYTASRPLSADETLALSRHRPYGQRTGFAPLPWRALAGKRAAFTQALPPTPQAHAQPTASTTPPYRVQARWHGQWNTWLVMDAAIAPMGWTLAVLDDLSEVRQARLAAQWLTGLAAGLLGLGALYWRQHAHRQAEQRLRAQEAQLQHATRLASLGEMGSTLAHELNQPLMALSNYAAAARRFAEQGATEWLLQSIDEMQAQAGRAAEIVSRMRGFVRQRSAGLEPCALPGIVQGVLALLRPEVEARRFRIECQLPADLPGIRADRLLLEQLLLNLLLNALQAAQDLPPERRSITLSAQASASELALTVSDTGPGVPASLQAQLFQPFFSTKPDGLGLGLRIARSIAESHGGRLLYRPAEPHGACFTLTLPIPTP